MSDYEAGGSRRIHPYLERLKAMMIGGESFFLCLSALKFREGPGCQ